jgi:hypothetical protein
MTSPCESSREEQQLACQVQLRMQRRLPGSERTIWVSAGVWVLAIREGQPAMVLDSMARGVAEMNEQPCGGLPTEHGRLLQSQQGRGCQSGCQGQVKSARWFQHLQRGQNAGSTSLGQIISRGLASG